MTLTINIASESIVVPLDATINIQNQESFLYRNQRGERTFPFKLPWTPQLRKLYGYIEEVFFQKNESYTRTATLLADGYLITEGDLVVTDATEQSLQLEFRVPPGNISTTLWNKKLRDCNFGSETAPTTTKALTLYKKFDTNRTYTATASTAFIGQFNAAIYVGDQMVSSAILPYGSKTTTGGTTTWTFTADNFKTCMQSMIAMQRLDQYGLFFQSGYSYLIIRLLASTEVVKFKFFVHPSQVYELDFDSLTYQSVGNYYDKYQNPDIPNVPVVLPVLFNSTFYGSNGGNGNINTREDGHIQLNTEMEPTRNVLMPGLTLHFVLAQIMEEIGYTLAGDLLTDTDLKYAFLITNTAAGRPLDGTDTLDLFPITLKYADYAPNMTIKDFLDLLFDQLGVVPTWDTTNKILYTKFVQSVVDSTNIYTIEKKAFSRRVRISEAKNIWVKWDSVDDKKEMYAPYPTTEPTNAETINLKFPPILLENSTYQLVGEGQTPINSQQNNEPIVRLAFCGANGAVTNQRGAWNFSLVGTINNLYTRVFAPQAKYLNSAEYDYNTVLKLSEVLKMQQADKLLIDNVHCFVKERNYKIQPFSDYFDVKLTIVSA